MNHKDELGKIAIGVVIFLVGYATYEAAQPNGGTVWVGGMGVGALLAVSGMWRLLAGAPSCAWKGCRARRSHDVFGFDPDVEYRDAGLCDTHTAVILYSHPNSWARHLESDTQIKTDDERLQAIRRLAEAMKGPSDARGR